VSGSSTKKQRDYTTTRAPIRRAHPQALSGSTQGANAVAGPFPGHRVQWRGKRARSAMWIRNDTVGLGRVLSSGIDIKARGLAPAITAVLKIHTRRRRGRLSGNNAESLAFRRRQHGRAGVITDGVFVTAASSS